MAGPQKNRSRREAERPGGPPSSSVQSSSAQSSSGRSNASSAQDSVKTTSTSAKTVISAQYDGPQDSKKKPAEQIIGIKNLENMGLSMWRGHLGVGAAKEPLPLRNGKFNALGRETPITLNVFDVLDLPSKTVQQYDVTIVFDIPRKEGPSRMVQMKVWSSKTVSKAIGQDPWLFDGNKLAWSTAQIKNINLEVDLGAEEGRRSNAKSRFRVRIEPTKAVSFTMLQGFLAGQVEGSDAILETVSFLDHLLREGPSRKYTQIKKNFFARGEQRFSLGNGVEALKGVFASCRMVLNAQRKPGMAINVDVANGTFLSQMDLIDSAPQVCRCRSIEDFIQMFAQAKGQWHKSNMYRFLKAYTHIGISLKHITKGQTFKVGKFLNKDAYEYTFEWVKRDDQGNVLSKKVVSVAQYFMEHHNMRCKKGLPVIELTKKDVVIPLEAAVLLPNQRYRTKLDDKQTSNMIKFAVTLPKDRWAAVQHGLKMLDWNNDKYLQAFGMKISTQPTQVKGRVLPPPEPTFQNGKIDAKSAAQGRWRIDGKKFHTANPRPLKAWGFCIVDSGRGPCVNSQQAEHFADRFVAVARAHGMQVPNGPHLCVVKTMRGGEMISDAWNGTGNKFQTKPSMLFFVVPTKDVDLYRRIKKSCECRYGVVSQVLQSAHVLKAQDQYISNVCMKVNAKLGGATCVARGGLTKINPNWGKAPTMIIGADVSHASPGDDSSGSMAAFTMSLDREFTRYAAQCETNGNRVEIIATHIIDTKLKAMVQHWSTLYAGNTPHQVIYFRDGVSEGQFDFVLKQEVADMRQMFKAVNPKVDPKFTVVICGKRHHVRFFPGRAGDRNENPIPGTLIETGITHPFETDYYLASHSAIKGTARPVHYNVIANENNYDISFIEQLSFEHCMQYARSTTPVSMVPPVYYAHLASNRCIAHKNEPTLSSGKKEANEKAKKDPTTLSSSDKTAIDIPPLMALNNSMGILGSMWYI